MNSKTITELRQFEQDISHATACRLTISFDLGQQFRFARQSKNRTSEWLARELGINPHHLTKLESGVHPIRAEFAERWMKILDNAPSMSPTNINYFSR